ncbi:AraC family transcriptional regulator [Thalassobius sp. Cn5-15]|uniref:AraC family transcriptional regulator n=1 Tax=Thalassobius sp. Cn5-15 TaxID=2917763 RepID=UPI001EF1C139|nr:AraC family transcriptional regulator [Thalassobius sp. Cn5-15]MCG7492641.1 AraC family transcriptional regulator [Thalassobius sp. Cn5-15]
MQTDQDQMLEQLKQIYGFEPGAGYVETHLPQVRFFWSTEPVPRAPLIYNAGLVLILRGHKTGYLNDHTFTYDPDHYLALSVPMPFDCKTDASADDPLLGLFIDVSRKTLHELNRAMGDPRTEPDQATKLGVTPAPMDSGMRSAIDRLMAVLCDSQDAAILGPGILREILYHALQGPHGSALRAIGQVDSHFDRIARCISQIREHYAEPISIDDMAQTAGMSSAVLHRAFKNVTGASPHQYLTATRLNRAKGMIIADGLPVAEAARQVGYDSAAHFSRAFRKHFGVSPRDARDAGYSPIDI